MKQTLCCASGLAAALLFSARVVAATLTVHAVAGGQPLEDAVITAIPQDPSVAAHAPHAHGKATMLQQYQQFDPFVLPVQVGTKVEFPNRDPFRHHVYANSPAKSFELKLYGGGQTQSLLFDKVGVVALGCNIHDNMLAYIDVVATPFFAKTDASGTVTIADLPAGTYTVGLWHPNQKFGVTSQEDVTLGADSRDERTMTTELRPGRHQLPPRPADESGY